jgi:hypothetical protein
MQLETCLTRLEPQCPHPCFLSLSPFAFTFADVVVAGHVDFDSRSLYLNKR